jgi:hypothetical protein
MPRQRSKKLSDSRKSIQKPILDIKEKLQDLSDDDVDSVGKDEEEEELDRLVLGDGIGFKAQLQGAEVDSAEEEPEDEIIEGQENEEVGLEGVDDADVSTPLFQALHQTEISSSSSLIQVHRHYFHPMLLFPLESQVMKRMHRLGRIAMMTA